MRALKDLLTELEKSGLTLEQQLLLLDLIKECHRIVIWRDTQEVDEVLHWLMKELHEPASLGGFALKQKFDVRF